MACRCGCCVGACCLPDGSCQASNCYECLTLGGQFQGMGSACSGTSCPCDPPAVRDTCHACVDGVSVSYCSAYCCAGVCQDSPCQSCTHTSDCPAGQCCIDSICVPCQPCTVDGDCPSGQCCVGGNCVTCGPCCVIDGVADYTKTEAQCVSYCTLNGSVVSSTGQSDCESKYTGHCELDGSTTGDDETGCVGGYCALVNGSATGITTQGACESRYDGCLITSAYSEIDGAIKEMPETDCAAGSPAGTYDCGMYLVTDDPADCPEGWFYGPLGGVNQCYTYKCVSTCDDCTDSTPGVVVLGCSDGAYMCAEGNTFTKHYGVWHAKTWIVDFTGVWHQATWYSHCPDGAAAYAAMQIGPGTELKNLLAKFGIHASPTCKCNKMAKQMNIWGPDESLNHIEEIVDVMEEEAKKRGLPFLRAAGRLLVRKAIRNSRGQ